MDTMISPSMIFLYQTQHPQQTINHRLLLIKEPVTDRLGNDSYENYEDEDDVKKFFYSSKSLSLVGCHIQIYKFHNIYKITTSTNIYNSSLYKIHPQLTHTL